MKKAFYEILPFWPLDVSKSENYFLLPPLIARKHGTKVKIIVLGKGEKRKKFVQGIEILYFPNVLEALRYIPKHSFVYCQTGSRYILLFLFLSNFLRKDLLPIWMPHTSFSLYSPFPFGLSFDIYKYIKFFIKDRVTILSISPKEYAHFLTRGYKNNFQIYLPIAIKQLLKIRKIAKKNVEFLFIGGDRDVKGLSAALIMFSVISKEIENCLFHVLGRVSSDFKQNHTKNINDQVIFHGHVSHLSRNFLSVFSRANYYINTSYFEGAPLAGFEAYFAGLNIIVSKLPTLQSIFGTFPCYINPLNIESSTRNIIMYIKSKEKNKAQSKFLKKMESNSFEKVFTSILDNVERMSGYVR